MISIGISVAIKNYIGSSVDANAAAFITAAGITDPTQQNAVDFLFKSLKGTDTSYNPTAINLYSKHTAFYPIVGGSASSHKFNGIDPQDTDAAKRIVFSGGWTHSANGMLPNGTNGYGNTFVKGSDLASNNLGFSIYSRTDNQVAGWDFGAFSNVSQSGTNIYIYYPAFGCRAAIQCADSNRPSFTPANSLGLFTAVSSAQNSRKILQAGVLKASNTTTDTATLSSLNMFVGCFNNTGSPSGYTNRQYAYLAVHTALTDAEALVYANIIQQYQVLLSRNV
jgi:hypothetical protein